MKLRVPGMAHDSADERRSDIGLLRSGAGNREEKAITKAPKTRKHEHALVQHQSLYGQGRCIEVEEQADDYLLKGDLKGKLRLKRKFSMSETDTHGRVVGGLQKTRFQPLGQLGQLQLPAERPSNS
jgi:hypothetical protein